MCCPAPDAVEQRTTFRVRFARADSRAVGGWSGGVDVGPRRPNQAHVPQRSRHLGRGDPGRRPCRRPRGRIQDRTAAHEGRHQEPRERPRRDRLPAATGATVRPGRQSRDHGTGLGDDHGRRRQDDALRHEPKTVVVKASPGTASDITPGSRVVWKPKAGQLTQAEEIIVLPANAKLGSLVVSSTPDSITFKSNGKNVTVSIEGRDRAQGLDRENHRYRDWRQGGCAEPRRTNTSARRQPK